jgi:hypothetical protein
MATTEVPDYLDRPLNPDMTIDRLRVVAQEWLAESMGNSDKAGEVEAVCYYDGNADALRGLLDLMTDEDGEDSTEGAIPSGFGAHTVDDTPIMLCKECHGTILADTEFGMCDGCLHDAIRSGWVPTNG